MRWVKRIGAGLLWLGMRQEHCAPLLQRLGLDADDSGLDSIALLLSPAPYLPMLNSMLSKVLRV